VLENEFLRAEIQSNGSIILLDKESGELYRGLAYFEDGGDAGDGYSYSYPAFDQLLNTLGAAPRISRLAAGPAVQRYRIAYDLVLPIGLTEDRRARRSELVTCPLDVVVSLGSGARRLELEITFDNRARDHRLRAIFPTDIRSAFSHSEAQFDVVAHPTRVPPVPAEYWVEDPPTQFPQQSFVDLSDGRRGLAILNVGLPEYEALADPQGEIKITLLRAVGYLGGEGGLQTIRSGAGPHIETPGAQIQRRLSYRLALFPHRGTWAEAEVWREAHAHAVPPRPRTTLAHPGDLPPRCSFLEVEGKNLVLSAVKAAEDADDTLIVRIYNPDEAPQSGRLRLFRPPTTAHVAHLDERARDPLPLAPDGSVPLDLPPKRIVTLRLTW
ncbi:MAG: glycoside hydrolase family 38 C-terminal domain-containing protein, partial [Ardenticatenaceae bacterium]